jgi:hypothetical protein
MLGQGFAATVLLSMLYLLVQGLGFFFSYEHSFFENGGKAYALTRGQPSYETYLNRFFWPFATLAEARLSSLRAHYARGNETYSHSMPTTAFSEYFQQRKVLPVSSPQSMAPGQPVAASAGAPTPGAMPRVAPSIVELAVSIQNQPDKAARLRRMQQVLQQLAGDAAAEQQLRTELARLKEERERAKVANDLSDLLED